MTEKSIVFMQPDYHCSFFYRDQLRKLGWKADIYVTHSYPEKLLYSNKDILRAPALRGTGSLSGYVNIVLHYIYYLKIFWKYKYHFYYGRPPIFHLSKISKLFGHDFSFSLWLAKLFNKKVIYLPTGCHDHETKENLSKLDYGNVCGNCGRSYRCDEKFNITNFDIVRRYADMCLGSGTIDSTQFVATHLAYKTIDLERWSPDLSIPEKYLLPPTENLRILHSFFNKNRNYKGRNIKGSPFVLAAIDQLKKEGHKIEYIYLNDIPSCDMHYYQAQADIVVDQLIYGWWGSTGVENMALGKPVVCYLRPEWKKFFLETFPEYNELPIVEADVNNIYDVLKKLVIDKEYRIAMGGKSRRFAERHFDFKKNAKALSDILLDL